MKTQSRDYFNISIILSAQTTCTCPAFGISDINDTSNHL